MSGNGWPDDMHLLHIYPQWAWHDSAQIWGTRAALETLRSTISRALEDGRHDGASFFASDGEGYHVTVHVISGSGFDRLGNHYGDAELTGPHVAPDNSAARRVVSDRFKAAR